VRFQLVPAAYVLLLRGDEVLLQLRQNTGYRDGHWAAAGAGHVEQGESVLAAAAREAEEEIGVVPTDLVPLTAMHRTHANGRAIDERVDFFFTCRTWTGEPHLREPEKSADLRWFPVSALPDPVVPHERFVLEGLRTGTLEPITTFGF
jgi:8-oxo-dGTP diphosphatase